MLPKQLDENPARDCTSKGERSQRPSYPGGPIAPQHSAGPKDKCAKNDANDQGGSRPADRRNPMFFDPLPAFGRSVDRRGPTKPSAIEIL
jgi:hypothetical protein